jgi:undecaprenyl-diphosphatase
MATKGATGLKRLWARLNAADRTELKLLLATFAIIAVVLIFLKLASEVAEGETLKFDEKILRALRKPEDPRTPIGPAWLKGAALDITALGGPTVLGLVVAAVTGFFLLHGLYKNALFVFAASCGGWLLNGALKALFARPRPDVVPHLREVASLSFPSGHALTSAVVYLTLGALLMRVAKRRLMRYYCMIIAMTATFIVGASRVYLGVHYPTDVLAGWLVGLTWASICLLLEREGERRYGLKKERAEAAS